MPLVSFKLSATDFIKCLPFNHQAERTSKKKVKPVCLCSRRVNNTHVYKRYVIQRGSDLKTLTDRQVESFLIGTHSSAFCRF